MRNLSGAIVALALAGIPAASANEFEMCDGYDPPTRRIDGLTNRDTLWGLATVDIRRGNFPLGIAGQQACDRALANPLLVEGFWLRRANLLQAKALHALFEGKHDVALEALVQSDALGKADPLFAASLGLGNRAIRAFVLGDMGRKQDALAELALMEQARPWSASVRRLTFRLRMRLDAASFMPALRADMPLVPDNAVALFWNSFILGDYAAAIDYAPAVSFDLPKMRGGWQIDGARRDELGAIIRRTELAGAHGFALAMRGRQSDSEAVLKAAADELTELMAPPPDRAPGRPARKSDIEDWQQRLPFGRIGSARLAAWRSGIEIALAAGRRDATEDLKAFDASPAAKLPILPGLLARVKIASPAEGAERDKLLAGFRADADTGRQKVVAFSVRDLVPLLPRHQTAKMVPVLKPAGDGYFLSDTGLSRARERDTDVWTLRFVHKFAPIQVVEEMVMFGAANTALREGKDSLIILSRRSAELTTHISSYYGMSSTENSGYEAQVRVHFVNAGQLPAAMAGAGWRVISAKSVIDDLAKRYRQSSGATMAW